MVYYPAAFRKKLGNDLCGYSVGECGDDEVGILCCLSVRDILAYIIYDAPVFGIYIGIGLACKSLAGQMPESEVRVTCETSDEFRAHISCGTYD